MNNSVVVFVFLASFLLLASSASAFNITRILNQFPDYSIFNELLTTAHLANVINSRGTITVLAVPNGAIGDLTAKPVDLLRRILATHVVLDYYDIMKLQRLSHKSAKLTNMFQQSGIASYDQGFLNVTARDGGFIFGSAVRGAQRDARVEKTVMSMPYNISILGISHPIVTPGLDGTLVIVESPPPPKASAPKASPPPAEAPAPAPEEEAEAGAPAPSTDVDDSDLPADAPVSSSPADAPSADEVADDDESDHKKSSAEKVKVSLGVFVVLISIVAAAY